MHFWPYEGKIGNTQRLLSVKLPSSFSSQVDHDEFAFREPLFEFRKHAITAAPQGQKLLLGVAQESTNLTLEVERFVISAPDLDLSQTFQHNSYRVCL